MKRHDTDPAVGAPYKVRCQCRDRYGSGTVEKERKVRKDDRFKAKPNPPGPPLVTVYRCERCGRHWAEQDTWTCTGRLW